MNTLLNVARSILVYSRPTFQSAHVRKELQDLCIKQTSIGLSQGHSMDLHTSCCNTAWARDQVPKKWLLHNKKIYPPQSPDEERRPAFVCHMKTNIKYSPWKMWYIAAMVRGMTVDEALKQLSFVLKKGAKSVKEAILEAQKMAVNHHNVEFKSNLWVAESFVGKGTVIKGIRRHARARVGKVEYFHCHYFVRLEEGQPPPHYYLKDAPRPGEKLLEDWLQEMRKRKITNSL